MVRPKRRLAAACPRGCFINLVGSVRAGDDHPGMAQNFIAVDRDQAFLMPPSLREWLPENHLAWYVLDAVAEMDLAAFYRRYRPDGWGRPAYEPAMMWWR
jgi:hypothetical protein